MSLFSGENPILGGNATVAGRKIQNGEPVSAILTAASVAQPIFIADMPYTVVGAQEVHAVVGGSGATVTIEHLTGTQAPGAGTAIFTAPLSLTGTINTVQKATLVAATSALQLATGDRLNTVFAGTLTGLAGGYLQLILVRT
jgi:hypothetical protein